jgi:2'-5' RNA ligase
MARCFIAIDLPREVIHEITRIQKIIRDKTLFTGKLTEDENLHLTLKFLGEIDENKVEEARKRLTNIKIPEFFAETSEVGVFIDNLGNKNNIKSKFSICSIRKQYNPINRIAHDKDFIKII